ncbi:EXCITATORY AMINO ACID TRANSPORTER [Salix viminalis]|uniref:EXCITATORY AMINO ACID TRANSPORTER n=1 Tax=Salix viminalis TaxID=40686 RepID=A0A9Q0QB88_SALVM|nr:EXCITATORY AMINO ACID TRANSPORTER [Salix viminalis]
MIGALLGLGTQMYSNALRKLPYMRHPWEHVVGMGLGVVFVNQLVKWDAQLEKDLDKMLQKAKEANERRYFVDNWGYHFERFCYDGLSAAGLFIFSQFVIWHSCMTEIRKIVSKVGS